MSIVKRGMIGALALAVAGTLAACGGGGEEGGPSEKNLRVATYLSENTAHMKGIQRFLDEVEKQTDGAVTSKTFYSGALLAAADTVPGVGSGRADLGYITQAYHPAELPLSSVVGIPFLTSDAEAQMRAFQELYTEVPAFKEEYEKQGLHVLFFIPVSPNTLGSKAEVDSLDWFSKRQVRGVGFVTEALKAVGANPIALPADEIYESIDRGVIDAYSGLTFDVGQSFKLAEVAPYVADTGLGVYASSALVINLKTWDSLDQDVQDAMEKAAQDYFGYMPQLYMDTEAEICKEFKAAGGKASILPEADVENWQSQIGDSIEEQWLKSVEGTVGKDAAQEFLDSYKAALDKYESQSSYEPGVVACAKS